LEYFENNFVIIYGVHTLQTRTSRIYSKRIDHNPEIPGGIEPVITRGIMLLRMYSFTFTSAFMQWIWRTTGRVIGCTCICKSTLHRAVSLRQRSFSCIFIIDMHNF